MSNVVIDIAAEFTGKKAFKQADTATDKLSKGAKKLAGAFGLALGGQAILAFGKASVKAAAADEKAQKQLALALKNVGLGRDAATSEAFIQRLQSEFGILDDKLRPAYQTLAVATRDSAEAQRLLNLALDISASTGKDLGSVTSALSKAFLGNNTALSKLGVGISKADLKAGKFDDIISKLETTFAGSATASANTFQGSIDKLGVASANVQEIIGTGLIDALKGLSDADSVDNLAVQMQSVATYVANTIRGIGVMIGYLKTAGETVSKIPGLNMIIDAVVFSNPALQALNAINKLGAEAAATAAATGTTAQALAHMAELQDKYTALTLGKKKKLTAEELKALAAAQKALAAKKLAAAIDKANLALGKGEDIFDMTKIQNAAALTNQAELLGKATTASQILQIANDVARLNVKRDILALEEAIASKDEAAIIAATNKLNADLKVLGALGAQNLKLLDIKSILETLKPKDLINIANLNEALDLLTKINLASTGSKTIPAGTKTASVIAQAANPTSMATLTPSYTNTPFGANGTFNLEDVARSSLLAGLAGGAGVAGAVSGSRYAAQAANQYNISIQAGIGDPNAIAEAVTQVIQDAVDRGTLRGGAY